MRFNSLKSCWVASCKMGQETVPRDFDWDRLRGEYIVHAPHPHTHVMSSSGAPHSMTSHSFGAAAVRQFNAICAEQDRLRTLFVSEVSRSLGGTVRRAAGRINNPLATHCMDGYSRKSSSVEQIVRKYEKIMVRSSLVSCNCPIRLLALYHLQLHQSLLLR